MITSRNSVNNRSGFIFQIVVAGLTLPTLGYAVGTFFGLAFRCPKRDVIAISIETGIQNVTLAVFMLNYSLPQPASTIAIGEDLLNSLKLYLKIFK